MSAHSLNFFRYLIGNNQLTILKIVLDNCALSVGDWLQLTGYCLEYNRLDAKALLQDHLAGLQVGEFNQTFRKT